MSPGDLGQLSTAEVAEVTGHQVKVSRLGESAGGLRTGRRLRHSERSLNPW